MALSPEQLREKLAEIDALRAEIHGALAAQTPDERIQALAAAQPHIKPGTKAHETLLSTGYGMSVSEAEQIVAERDKDATRWPLDEYRKAQALLLAYKAKPTPTSKRAGWKRG